MDPLHDTTPQRVAQVCVESKQPPAPIAPNWLFLLSVTFWVLGAALIGSVAIVVCSRFFHHYTEFLTRLSQGF